MTKRSALPAISAISLPSDQHYLTQGDAAAFVGLSPRTLARMRIAGGGPRFSRAGLKVIMYSRASLLSWLAAREFGSTSEEDTRVA